MSFKIIIDDNSRSEREKVIGSWEDHAREEFGRCRRVIKRSGHRVRLRLINPEGAVLLEYDQRSAANE
ncbi:hypothetical protein A3709_19425 [Halioglobus sp. HI00S01]|uniref:hypothetical protein n=1 Tax=Halioglobus sp. HI00S01 TaxID=1822214 RepID=UPI0007C21A0A|nr:hypothetical protein [Halioglobus sp. HI00S01]KZX57796.1 hypothetical protein A3709_19425 [Halioglobus sp. HI00S01]